MRKRNGEESASRKSSSWESQTAGRTRNSGAATAAVAAEVDIDLGPVEFLKDFPFLKDFKGFLKIPKDLVHPRQIEAWRG